MLSTADDATLVLSMLEVEADPEKAPAEKKQEEDDDDDDDGYTGGSASLTPVCRLDSIHNSGIFSMDERGSRVLTASKDGSVCLTALATDGLR